MGIIPSSLKNAAHCFRFQMAMGGVGHTEGRRWSHRRAALVAQSRFDGLVPKKRPRTAVVTAATVAMTMMMMMTMMTMTMIMMTMMMMIMMMIHETTSELKKDLKK